MTPRQPHDRDLEIPSDQLVRQLAHEFVELGGKRPPARDEESTMVALDGDAFLLLRLGRKPTERESGLFWDEVERGC